MVSLPTSGMQLAEATEVFSAVLCSVGINLSKHHNISMDQRGHGTFQLLAVVVSLIPSEDSDKGEETEPSDSSLLPHLTLPPAFQLSRLVLSGLAHNHISYETKSLSLSRKFDAIVSPLDVTFSVDVGEIEQHFNFALIRLILQISETLDVVKEQKAFAQRSTGLTEDLTGQVYNLDRLNDDLSNPNLQMSKSWRNMYNVLNLYAALPNQNQPPPPPTSPRTAHSPPCKCCF